MPVSSAEKRILRVLVVVCLVGLALSIAVGLVVWDQPGEVKAGVAAVAFAVAAGLASIALA